MRFFKPTFPCLVALAAVALVSTASGVRAVPAKVLARGHTTGSSVTIPAIGRAPVTESPVTIPAIGRVPVTASPTTIPKPTVIPYTEAALADQVKVVPGLLGKLPANLFSGYLVVGSKHIAYTFAESWNDASTDPVFATFSGGPGGDTMEIFLTEQGPFRVTPDANSTTEAGNLILNQYSFQAFGSGLYITNPVGTGYSYSTDPADYSYTDENVLAANLGAVQAFYAKFPQYAGNDLHINTESYGGHYGPQLAQAIIQNATEINLKSLFVINPINNFAEVQYSGRFGTLYGIMENCVDPTGNADSLYWQSAGCTTATNVALAEFDGLNISPYGARPPPPLHRYRLADARQVQILTPLFCFLLFCLANLRHRHSTTDAP
jgi:hypothetical protein